MNIKDICIYKLVFFFDWLVINYLLMINDKRDMLKWWKF